MYDTEGQQAAAVRHQLVLLVRAHGPELLDDARRVRAMLGDAVVGATAEANLVGLAISSGVPAKLRQGEAVSGIVAELQRTSSVQPHDAEWAVGAIAEALGFQSPAQSPAAIPQPSAVDSAATPMPASRQVGTDDLVITGAGPEVVVTAGTAVTIGRDPGCTVVLNSTAASRQHARIERGPSGWEYTDVGSTQGSFIRGVAVRTTTLTGPTDVTLGQGGDAVTLHLLPGGVAARPAPDRARPDVRAAAPATEIPGRPGGVLGVGAPKTEVTGGDLLTVTLDGSTRVVPVGGSLVIGRETDNDLVSSGTTASRHHLRIEHVGGVWKLRDLGSSAGTWLDGQRINETTLSGKQEFVLGDPTLGDKLVTEAAGSAGGGSKFGGAAGGVLRGRGGNGKSAWLVPMAVAAAGILVLGVAIVGWRAVSPDDKADAATMLTKDQLARATVKLDFPGHWSGSGVVVDNKLGLIMTNAHVAQPQAVGQALPPTPADQPIMSTELDDEPNPKEMVVYVSKDGRSAALPRFLAEPVAWDGYLDVAVLQIKYLYNGSDDASDAPVAGPSDWEDLPEVPLGDSKTLQSGDDVEIYGYPGVQGSQAPSYIPGSLSSPVQDNRLAAKYGQMANQAIWNFTGQIEHGNSGGLAVDKATHTMIGIPTWLVPDRDTGAPVYSRFRPIDFVKPVLQAAQRGEKYISPFARPGPHAAQVDPYEYGKGSTPGVSSCGDEGEGSLSWLSFKYKGFPSGQHTDLAAELWAVTNNQLQLVDYAVATVPNQMKSSGCVTFTFHDALPAGSYEVEIGVGGDLHVIYDATIPNLWS